MQVPLRMDELIDHVRSRRPDGDALGRLPAAVLVSADLAELADQLVGHFVDHARREGASWSDIGQNLGVSKQAAQKRFGAWPSGQTRRSSRGLFDRLTAPARRVAEEAQEQARRAGHDEVDTNHLLLGLLVQPQALAAQAIEVQGVSLTQVREAASAALATLERSGAPVSHHVPFGPEAKNVLQVAVREAVRQGQGDIGTEHILLGLLGDESTPGARALTGLGITREVSRRWILTQPPEHRPDGG